MTWFEKNGGSAGTREILLLTAVKGLKLSLVFNFTFVEGQAAEMGSDVAEWRWDSGSAKGATRVKIQKQMLQEAKQEDMLLPPKIPGPP